MAALAPASQQWLSLTLELKNVSCNLSPFFSNSMRHFNEILTLFFHDSNSLEPKIHRLKHFFNFGEEVQGFEDISQQFF